LLDWKINLDANRRDLSIAAIWVLVLVLLILAVWKTQPETPPAPNIVMLLGTPVGTNAQATLAAALTQEKNNADKQAAATAEIIRANAQATLNSANATLSAAQTQQENSADVIAAQIAAAAEIVRANAQATLNSASSTQSAAMTQAQFNLEMTVVQLNKNEIAAGTQTAVANLIATQTQAAVATSQWYTALSRQREEQRQGPIEFLWTWCLPIFVVLFAGLCLWGFWRWLKIEQNRQRIAGQPIEKLPAPVDPSKPQDGFLPPESEIINGRYRLTKPDEQMRGWMDEIKRKLLNREKDNDDNPDS
jgi:hypothetical protein